MTPITDTQTIMAEGLSILEELDAVKTRIMENRGARHPETYSAKNLLSPTLLKDGEKAADRLAKAIILKQRIVAVSDFDSDGANAGAIFIRGMNMLADSMIPPKRNSYTKLPEHKRRKATLDYVIPNRFIYGYGLKPLLAEEVVKPLEPDVVVTLDNGISSHDAVTMISTWAKRTDVIITDHHAPGDSLPNAFAVVNPNRKDCDFPSKALCGAGVAFYLLLLVRRSLIALIGNEPRRAGAARAVKDTPLNNLLDYVAVGTIGDLVPMDANNRLLVKAGMDRINRGIRMPAKEAYDSGMLSYGVRALLEVSGTHYPITTTDIAFNVVPRINAVGRLEEPVAGIECLLAETQMIADMEAKKCHKLNDERKKIQKEMEQEANEILNGLDECLDDTASDDENGEAATVLFKKTWHPGIVGLVASRVKEKTRGAVICFSPETDPNDENAGGDPDWLKGSGRSDNVHLRDTLAYVAAKAPDLMMQFGGHARAAGLSLNRADMPRFKKLFRQAVDHFLKTAPLTNEQYDDGELPVHLRSRQLVDWIEKQPWGQKFPEPTFTQTFQVNEADLIKEVHQKLVLSDTDADAHAGGHTAAPITMLWFFSVDEKTAPVSVGDVLMVTYKLNINRFRGQNELQGIIVNAERTESAASLTEPANDKQQAPQNTAAFSL